MMNERVGWPAFSFAAALVAHANYALTAAVAVTRTLWPPAPVTRYIVDCIVVVFVVRESLRLAAKSDQVQVESEAAALRMTDKACCCF